MPLYDFPNATSGADNFLVEIVSIIPSFIPLLLTFVFFIVFLGGIGRQKARTGSADYAMWAVIASLSTFMLSLIMSTATGIIDVITLVIVVVITIFSGVWLFLDKKQSEV